MTSLAVLPLQRTNTEPMEEDLYALSRGGSNTSSFGGVPPQPTSNTNTLSNLLNIPDSFVDHYSKASGQNTAKNTVPSLFSDTFESYGSSPSDPSTQTINPFNIYAHPESFTGTQTLQQNQARPAPLSRITTLADHEALATGPAKDDDYYLFNTDISPSQMMSSKNYFSPEGDLDSSMFIMNGDFDFTGTAAPENEYMNLGGFAEDAEDLSDDSDDDNYFQDEDDEDMNDFTMSFADLPDRAQPESFMDLPTLEGAKSPDAFKTQESFDDDMMYEDPMFKPESGSQEFERSEYEKSEYEKSEFERSQEFDRSQGYEMSSQEYEHAELTPEARSEEAHYPEHGKMHLTEEDHKTAAEISALNPDHLCDLTNPATGKPCNKQFSRPYDLIRHQETIHAAKKKVFRCVICEGREHGGAGNGKSKTFSRGDALSRHIKVKHGFSGKEAVELINEAKKNVEYVHL